MTGGIYAGAAAGTCEMSIENNKLQDCLSTGRVRVILEFYSLRMSIVIACDEDPAAGHRPLAPPLTKQNIISA